MDVVGEGDESSSDEASDEEGVPDETGVLDETEFAVASGVDVDLILPSPKSTGKYVNKQRCLILSSRGGESLVVLAGGLLEEGLVESFGRFVRCFPVFSAFLTPPPLLSPFFQSLNASATFSRTSAP